VRQREARDGKYQLVDSFAAGESIPVASHTIPVDDIPPQND
jgi:antitoxin (DNA-binding transcriptional repressor) of toxin-antitoxin stability system